MPSHESYHPKHTAPEDADLDEAPGRHRAPRHAEGSAETADQYTPRHLDDEYTPRHGGEDLVDDDHLSPEERETLARDERNRYTDRELLHGSRAVAAAITEHSVKATSEVLQAWAAVRNGVTSPRRGFHNFLVSRAEKKLAKRERKLGLATDKVYQDHAQASLDKAQHTLDKRQEKQGSVADKATSRVERAKQYRSTEHQDFVNHLMEKKGAAVLRKEMRHRLREQGATRWRSRSLSKQIARGENAKHAINMALVSHATEREHEANRNATRRHNAKYETTFQKIQTAEQIYAKASENLARVTREIAELEAMLPEARDKLDAVGAELKAIDAYDVRRIDAETRYDAAGKAYHRYDAAVRDKKREADSYRRQMQKQLGRFEKHTETSKVHGEDRRVAEDVERRSKERYRVLTDASSDAVNELLNPTETPKEQPETQETEE